MNFAGRKLIYEDRYVPVMQVENRIQELNDFVNTDSSQQLVSLLIKLGVQSYTAKCLACLHNHGPSTSRMLQNNCNIRQPDVSVAIAELRRLNVVELDSSAANGRGRPSHIYHLKGTLNECIIPFIEEAQNNITHIISAINTLEQLARKMED